MGLGRLYRRRVGVRVACRPGRGQKSDLDHRGRCRAWRPDQLRPAAFGRAESAIAGRATRLDRLAAQSCLSGDDCGLDGGRLWAQPPIVPPDLCEPCAGHQPLHKLRVERDRRDRRTGLEPGQHRPLACRPANLGFTRKVDDGPGPSRQRAFPSRPARSRRCDPSRRCERPSRSV